MTAVPHTAPPQDLRRLEDEVGVEFANGQIVEKPVSIRSAKIEMTIGRLLGNETARTKSAEVFSDAVGYQCYADDPSKFRRPDVSLVRAERMRGIDTDTGFLRFPADLVVEVISPNDLAAEIDGKVEEYLENGFPLIWVIHPATRTTVIHRADGSTTRLHEADEITGESALPGFRCKVAAFFE